MPSLRSEASLVEQKIQPVPAGLSHGTAQGALCPAPSPSPPPLAEPNGLDYTLPHTSILAHAPGWTLFRNLYMSNGTLLILSDNQSFPEIRLMTSTGLPAENTPENIATREPTAYDMEFITPEAAQRLWGGSAIDGEKSRVWSVSGNTLLFNDPSQFLRHYYHFVAELFFGVWAFWHGAWIPPSASVASQFTLSGYNPPEIHRAIFAHSNADGWRDNPGFDAYFLRAASHRDYKSWDRAWHFPVVLLTDRSAAHRGVVCGSQTQRTAAEAWEYMRNTHRLLGESAGGWWEPVRAAVWRFAGLLKLSTGNLEDELPLPEKVQTAAHRKLIQEDHDNLVAALEDLIVRRGSNWELQVMEAEKMTKDEQIKAVARTTFLVGVHGNGLTHLVFMEPTRSSAGFAHDYQWTSTALGINISHHRSIPHKPDVNYPDGFQENEIPVHGPTVTRIIEDHFEQS
ncbi:hypothetical protein BD779DRAFT_1515909 [Infundibulicybe gibba]|nr:hypothetical protein BD779DRAFT_1515909 [Infundibulicybe gibba]